jgi:hypothetical protein
MSWTLIYSVDVTVGTITGRLRLQVAGFPDQASCESAVAEVGGELPEGFSITATGHECIQVQP